MALASGFAVGFVPVVLTLNFHEFPLVTLSLAATWGCVHAVIADVLSSRLPSRLWFVVPTSYCVGLVLWSIRHTSRLR